MNHVANGPEPDDEDAHVETLVQNLVVVNKRGNLVKPWLS